MLRARMRNVIGAPDGEDGGVAGVLGALAAALRPVVRTVANLLAELFDRIIHGIRCLPLPLVLGLGCQSTNDVVDVAPAVERVPAATMTKPEDTGPRPLGQFTITFYYVVGEEEVAG